MKIARTAFVVITLLCAVACSKSSDDDNKPLVNHENKGDMGKQLEGTAFQGYGDALDKGHNVTDTLQQSADRTKAQDNLQNQ